MDRAKKKITGKLYSEMGFTLLEILATFVLIAIILPVTMEGISLSTRMAGQSKRKIEAAVLAEKWCRVINFSGGLGKFERRSRRFNLTGNHLLHFYDHVPALELLVFADF